jgi:hypothetical protein
VTDVALQPPENLDDDQLVYWKELVNRVHAAVAATETPGEPTMEQVGTLAANVPGVDDPETGFKRLPDGWDASTVAEVWTKVGGSFTSCKAKFMGEEGWTERKANRFCAALKDEVLGTEEWREGGGQRAGGRFSMIPGVPNDPNRITRDILEDIARWKMNSLVEQARTAASLPPLAQSLNGTVEVAADWNPSLHPRNPENGQFIERPWDMDIGLEDINSESTGRLVQFLGETTGEPDMDAVLSDDGIRIDGVPDDVDTVDELKGRMDNPQSDTDVPTNPKDFGELGEGDVFQRPGGSPAEVLNKGSDGETVEVRTPDGERSTFRFNEQSRSTVDVYDVDGMDDLPSQGGDTPDEPTLDSVTPDDPRFSEPGSYKMDAEPGDLIRYEQTAAWGDEQDDMEPKVGELVSITGTVMEVQPKDGDDTIRFNTNDGGSHQPTGLLSVGDDGVDDPTPDEGDIPNVSDPEGGRWRTESVLSPDEGDYVRFNSPRTMELEGGEVIDDGGMGPMTVVTPDGGQFDVDNRADADNGVYEFKGVFEPESSLTDDDFYTVDDMGTTDLTELDGTPEERREVTRGEVLGEIPRDAVENEDIPEGTLIAKDRQTPFVYEVTGYDDTVTGKELEVVSDGGREQTISARIANERYKFYEPGDVPDVTVSDGDWGDDDTALATRKRNLKSVLDDITPNAPGDPANNDDELDEDTFEQSKERVAQHLARSNDKEHAERVMARLTSVGRRGRAHAVSGVNTIQPDTAYFSVSDGETDNTIVHELGHVVGDVYGFQGGSNDMDGKTHPMPDFAWNSPNYDVPQKYGLKTPPWSDDFEDANSLYEQPSYKLDEWKDDVDAEVGTGLDGRNFSGVESNSDVPLQEGAMIRLNREPSRGEPKNWRIANTEENPPEYPSEVKVTLEDRSGRQVDGFVDPDRTMTGRIGWTEESPFISYTDITGKRNGTPDNWREDPADADDWLGTMDPEDHEDAVRNLGEYVNKAWYRQAAASREHGANRETRKKYAIDSGYSAKQAHETWSRIHEVMRPTSDLSNDEMADSAYTLVTRHPDLLEAYRNVYDIPASMKVALNTVLEQEGRDFRFDGIPDVPSVGDVDTVEDAVREKYNEGDFQ